MFFDGFRVIFQYFLVFLHHKYNHFDKIMRRLFPYLLLLCAAMPTLVRGDTIDSLYQILNRSAKADIDVANRLMVTLDAEGATDTLYRFQRGDANWEVMKTVSLMMAFHYDAAYQYAKAAEAFMASARHAERGNDLAAQGDALSQAAVEYHRIGAFEQSIEATERSLHIDSLMGDTALLSNDFSTLAATLLTTGRPDDAARCIMKSITIEQSRHTPTKLAIRYGHAAEIFNKAGQTDTALHYAEMAYELDRQAGNQLGTARRMSQMADIYAARGETNRAEAFYTRAIDQLKELGDLRSLCIDYKQLGNMYLRLNDYGKALHNLLQADSIAKLTGSNYLRSLIAPQLAATYRALKRDDRACDYLQLTITLNDSIYGQRVEQLSATYHARFAQERQMVEMERQNVQQQQWLIAAVVLIVILLAGLVFLRWRSHRLPPTADAEKKPTADDRTLQSQSGGQATVPLSGLSAVDRQFMLNVVDYVHANMKVRKITIDQLAQEMCMSRSQFSRRLTALAGDSPNNFLMRIRMEKAVRLLKDTNMPVKEIAYECGFDEANYFIHVFRQFYNMTPTQFRNTPSISKN